jgi:VIT1/CCC1 family predicted Fe2+/Mn2+ transporter
MSEFSGNRKEKLLQAAKKIHEHKLEKIYGFKDLSERLEDIQIKNLLTLVYTEEENNAEFWAHRIKELGGQIDRHFFGDLKPYILLKILKTKGFFEWVIEEEEEGIKELALQSELILDKILSETWSRYASEEMRQLQRTKNQVLGMDSWDIRGTSGARNVSTIYSSLYGGLLSTLAFVTGLFGAQMSANLIIISGLATLFAGSISSAGGAYQSVKSEIDVLIRESKRDSLDGSKDRKQLLEFYLSEGYSEKEANLMIRSIEERRPSSIEEAIDKLGLTSKEIGNPVNTGTSSGLYFAIGAMVPIIPFMIRLFRLEIAMGISICATLLGLFLVGAAKSIFSREKWIRSGLEVMVFGAIASTITYIFGNIVSLLMR